ncbi:hypothetical protein [Anabaena lutea]|uniref:Uncharacterized protein n=1 Tax=Anabaena lutea FACHB-196 TaxID=2692881 RepID=A0ABR8FCX8_9NOST|nr:hypothetical protein [Anabaena lutea]MBD2567991.1 hypothetical protein [Anabaena lutea FACHB-196]
MNQKHENHKVITDKNRQSPLVRNGFIFIFSVILFVAAIYYGIINP